MRRPGTSSVIVVGALLLLLFAPTGRPAAAGSEVAAEPGSAAARAAAKGEAVVSADLTPDGLDHYRFSVSSAPTATPASSGSRRGAGSPEPASGSGVSVVAPPTNNGGNLRSVWWFDGEQPAVDGQSCATWSEYSGPIVQAGVALRVRQVGAHTQAITVTNNIMWGARNGWNVHLWNGGTHGELIGQAVLSHSFGGTAATPPPLPWRVCARVVGATLQFKAWSQAAQPSEPEWSDPGFGASFTLPRGWVYPGRSGWYVGHLQRNDATDYRALQAGALEFAALDRLAVRTDTVAGELQRTVARRLTTALGRAS